MQHLPESGNINNCQTSATVMQFVQLRDDFMSPNILLSCKNEQIKPLHKNQQWENNLRAIIASLSSLNNFAFVCFLWLWSIFKSFSHAYLSSYKETNQPKGLNQSINCDVSLESSLKEVWIYRMINYLWSEKEKNFRKIIFIETFTMIIISISDETDLASQDSIKINRSRAIRLNTPCTEQSIRVQIKQFIWWRPAVKLILTHFNSWHSNYVKHHQTP